MSSRLQAKIWSVGLVLVVLTILGLMELQYRTDLAVQLKATEFSLWAGYSDPFSACTAPDIDVARGRVKADAKLGLMKPDHDVTFWWFDGAGNILHEATFHLNNVGLISQNDYSPNPKPGEFRIVVLGDEMTAATTAALQWPDLLEQDLNRDRVVRAQLGTVRVFNFGHPDVSVAQMAIVWEKKARRFKPDMVIVNSVSHSFDRMSDAYFLCTGPKIAPPASAKSATHSQDTDTRLVSYAALVRSEDIPNPPLPEFIGHVVKYAAPGGDEAWLSISCGGGAQRLRDPRCNAGRPFALWLPPSLVHNREELTSVQRQIVDDYVDGVLWTDWRPLALLSLLGQPGNPLERRIQQPQRPQGQEPDEQGMQQKTSDERVAFVRRHLHRIADSHPELMVIQNPYYPEVLPPPRPFPLSRRLAELDPRLAPLDMREILLLFGDAQEVRTWWQVPVAAEKWSSRGQYVYARAVKVAILDYLIQRGRIKGLEFHGRASAASDRSWTDVERMADITPIHLRVGDF
jgi:hypothetical protein